MPQSTSKTSSVTPTAEQVTGGLLAGHDRGLKEAGKAMLKGARGRVRFVGKWIPGAPGALYDVASIATADDRLGEGAETAGSMAGAALGGALGAIGGPVGAVAGATVGSMMGEKAAEALYDHYGDDLRRGVGSAKAWVKAREEDIARKVRGELRGTFAPLRQVL